MTDKIYIHKPRVNPRTANCIAYISTHGFMDWIRHLTILVPATMEESDIDKITERIAQLEEILAKFAGWYCSDMPPNLIMEAEITMVLMVNFIGYLRGFTGLKPSPIVLRVNQMIDAKQQERMP